MTKKFDRQKVFDKVRKHLLKQNEKAEREDKYGSKCRYRLNKDGKLLKCAVGCLIPKRLYIKEIESISVSSSLLNTEESDHIVLLQILKDSVGEFTRDDLDFLSELQNIHDIHIVSSWKRILNDFAKEHDLWVKK